MSTAEVLNETTEPQDQCGLTLRLFDKNYQRLQEQLDLLDRMVDMSDIAKFGDEMPSSPMLDAENFMLSWPFAAACVYRNEAELRQIRATCRAFGTYNAYAIGATEGRINYVVGNGHQPTVAAKDPDSAPASIEDTLSDCRDVIDEFVTVNKWHKRQQETQRRLDRDGECFRRKFDPTPEGILRLRFVEPLCVQNPPGADSSTMFGIEFDQTPAGVDYETPVAYWVRALNYTGAGPATPDRVEADQIQHLKANVDLDAPRGVSVWWPLIKHMQQAVRMLANTGTMVEIRTRIAAIRKHVNGTRESIQKFAAGMAAGQGSAGTSGTMTNVMRYPPGSMVDVTDQIGWEFPSINADIRQVTESVQAVLRMVAVALQLPEYMLTADASNANFSSTMVAEGPAVKQFERMQQDLVEADIEILNEALQVAADHHRIRGATADTILDLVKLRVEPPQLVSRDRLKDTQADGMLVDKGAMSLSTLSARNGLEWNQEQDQIETEQERRVGYAGTIDPQQQQNDPFAEKTTAPQDQNPQDAEAVGGDGGASVAHGSGQQKPEA